ncbi:hypothetical protein [Hyalangium versicolor]|uniref:hypothetical protein n=1 Tax=Hyalangium versicolor TaxID=2861190 RepID=UPI001CCA49DD|nr:hypothetical protein [Hyalangium versicolor]
MQKLLRAGVLIPDESNLRPGHEPRQVRFFHDSMQSYLTARGLFQQAHEEQTWEILQRAAGDPLFAVGQAGLGFEAGSELFQMCLQVFGPEARLRHELRRQLHEWAYLYDDDLNKRDITSAVPDPLRPRFRARLSIGGDVSPRSALHIAIELSEEELQSLGLLYMRMAILLWPLRQPEQELGA